MGLDSYLKEDFRSARELLPNPSSLPYAETQGKLVESRLLRELAMIAARTNEPGLAAELAQAALKLAFDQAPGSLAQADSEAQLARLHYEKRDLRKAISLWQMALEKYETLWPSSPHIGGLRYNLGNCYHFMGDDKRSAEFLSGALEFWRTHPPASKSAVANLLVSLGTLHRARGDLEGAERNYQEAVEIIQRQPNNQATMASALNNMAILARQRGDFELAESRWRRSLAGFADTQPDSQEVADVLTNLSGLFCEVGEVQEARALLDRAIAIQRRLAPRSSTLALQLNSIAHLYARDRDFGRALEALNEANGLVDATSPLFATGLINLGNLYSLTGDYSKAKTYFSKVVEGSETGSICRNCYARCLYNLGNLALREDKINDAEALYKRALAAAIELADSPIIEADVYYALAEVYLKRQQYDLARESLLRAIDRIDRQVLDLGGAAERKSEFRSRNRKIYRKTILASMRLGELAAAFQLAERSRAQGFLELLQERSLEPTDKAGTESIAAIREIETRLNRVRRVRSDPRQRTASGELEAILREEQQLFEAREQRISELRTQAPRLAALNHPQPVNTPGAQSSLDSGSLMLSYLTGNEESYLFSLTYEDGLQAHTVVLREDELRQRIERFRQLIPEARPGTALGDLKLAELRRLGKELYNLLLAPAADRIEKAERVMIIADGPLHYLPFVALTREVIGEDGIQRDQYLAEWRPFHSVLSATVFAELKKDRRDPTKPDDGTALQFVAFGDPVFPASLSPKVPDKIADIRVRSAARRGALELARLPHTRREVEGIAALFPPDRVRTFLGAEATEEQAKAVGKGARILHFATHAKLDDRFPLNSSLLLSMPEGFPEDRENGLLQVWEIFERVRLDADLVVLSACESGLGEEQGGEGLIGLTRAFQYAGARTVLASLWEVRDEATAELMIRFYRHLTAGKPKDRALQAAQRELLAGPIEIPGEDGQMIRFDATAPYYWAAFQVIGDWM